MCDRYSENFEALLYHKIELLLKTKPNVVHTAEEQYAVSPLSVLCTGSWMRNRSRQDCGKHLPVSMNSIAQFISISVRITILVDVYATVA